MSTTIQLPTCAVEIYDDSPATRDAIGALVGVAIRDTEDYARALAWAAEADTEADVDGWRAQQSSREAA